MKRITLFIHTIPVIILFSCQEKQVADLIVHNATVYTVDESFSIKEAFVVKDGRFIDVGSDREILRKFSSSTIIDAEGKSVYPGLIDGHCHYYGYGMGLIQYADLTGTKSFEAIIRRLQNFHESHPHDWLVGRGWDQNDWEIKEFPDNQLLDELFPNHPVILTRIDGHAVLANSEALRRAGIDENSLIPGGDILIQDGRLTGILIDNAADTAKAAIPEPDTDKIADALLEAQKQCFSVGLTSVVDAGLDLDVVRTIDSLNNTGELKMRINAMISPKRKNLDEVFKQGPYHTDYLRVNSIKMYADGALGSRGALMLEPYSDDPGNYGLLMASEGYYKDFFREAYDNNFQVNTHCIGDAACRMILELYGEVLEGKNDRRWRIEHSQIVHPDDFKLYGKYNVIPSVQGTHATSDMYWAGDRVGVERLKGAYAFKELLAQNGWLVNGTDFPVENINPFYTFYASVFRKDLDGWPEEGFLMENALTKEEALRSITIWAAKGSFEEAIKGSIEQGKFADFVITDRDIMLVDEKDIPGTMVADTYVAGARVY